MKKVSILLFSAILSAIVMCEKGLADNQIQKIEGIKININNQNYNTNDDIVEMNNRIMFPIRSISERLGADVQWNQAEQTATIITENKDVMELKINNKTATINGEDYTLDVLPIVYDERIYVPARLIAEINHTKVQYNNQNGTVYMEKTPTYIVGNGEDILEISKKFNITTEDLLVRNGLTSENIIEGQQLKIIVPYIMNQDNERLYYLSKIIEAEAGGEPMEGKIAVGDVVLNRVNSSQFPHTIKDVIFQTNQFEPISNGRFTAVTPSSDSIQAAKDVLNGENVVPNALFFYNPSLVVSGFFARLTFVKKIGNHYFFK